MIMPWFINPWAEVRRLRRELREMKTTAQYMTDAYDKASREKSELTILLAKITEDPDIDKYRQHHALWYL